MIRLNEALEYAAQSGKSINKIRIAEKLWKTSNRSTQAVNFSNLISGRTKLINPEWVNIICEETGVDANFLFKQNESTL